MVLDQDTALVTLTHDPKIDDAALHWGLPTIILYRVSWQQKNPCGAP